MKKIKVIHEVLDRHAIQIALGLEKEGPRFEKFDAEVQLGWSLKPTSTSFKKGHVPWHRGKTGVYDDNTRAKMSYAQSQRIGVCFHTDEWKQNMSKRVSGEGNPMYGMSGDKNPFHGKHHTEETKTIMSQKAKEILECPHCKQVGGKSAMKRWHFDNCRGL